MRTGRVDVDGWTYFTLAGLDAVERAAARDLGFEEFDGGVARRFPRDTASLDAAHANFERHAAAMLRQAAGLDPVPWDRALAALLDRLRHASVDWWLAGSAALAVRGLAVRPRDIDVIVDGPGAVALGVVLADHLVEPVAPSDGWIAGWWGRAFPGARIEWVGDVRAAVDEPEPVDYGPVAATRLERVRWRDDDVRVPPLALQLAVARRRGQAGRVALIEAALAARGGR
jgi:hypothetical protein